MQTTALGISNEFVPLPLPLFFLPHAHILSLSSFPHFAVKPGLQKVESGVGLCEKEEEEEEEEEEMEGRESDSGMSEGAVGISRTSPCSHNIVEDAKRIVDSVIGVHVDDIIFAEQSDHAGGRGKEGCGIAEEEEEDD